VSPETLASWATTGSFLVALVVFAIELRASRKEREYQSFLTLLEKYDRVVEDRREKWRVVKEALEKNPKVEDQL